MACARERIGGEMMRMLALPKVARTLAAMTAIGLLALGEEAVPLLLAYEEMGGQSVASRLVLLGLATDDLQASWRLPTDLVKAAGLIGKAADLLARDEIAAAAYRYGEAAVEGLAVAAAREGWSRDRLGEAARELGRMVVPPFPVTGHDLADLGIAPGPALGQELARLEDTWINSRFALSKIELLSLVTR